jgi:hypothetical protein
MKIFQVEDEHEGMILAVLDGISRCPAGEKVDAFAFGVTYTDGQYSTGWAGANPKDLSNISGYIMLEASMRYIKMNRAEFEDESEVEEDGQDH